MNPEELFKIKDSEGTKLPEKDIRESSSSDKKTEDVDVKPKNKETTVDDLMSFLKENKVQADPKSIQNYYNQIVENKKYINEYNQQINNLEQSGKNPEQTQKGMEIPNSINDRLSNLESKLAELNTIKREKEDEIKSIINNIFEENKSENNQNVSFETKNSFLNLVMRDSPKEETLSKSPEKVEEKKETIPVPIVEKENKEVSSFLGEKVEEKQEKKTEESPIVPEKTNPIKNNFEENVQPKEEKKEPFSNLKKEEIPEKTKEESNFSEKTSNNEDQFEKLSDNMQKGFESILNAIKGIPSSQQKQEEQPQQKKETQQTQTPSPEGNTQKTPQRNYIDDYRETLRSNAPLKGYVGIKGMNLKANNIGSYT